MRPFGILAILAVCALVVSGWAISRAPLPARAQGDGSPVPDEAIELLGFAPDAGGSGLDLWHLRVVIDPDAAIEPGEHIESGTGYVEAGTIYLTPLHGTVLVAPAYGAPIVSTDGTFSCEQEGGDWQCEVPIGLEVVLGLGNEWSLVDAGVLVKAPEQEGKPVISLTSLVQQGEPPIWCGRPCPPPPWEWIQ
jgi:hypothetical protein